MTRFLLGLLLLGIATNAISYASDPGKTKPPSVIVAPISISAMVGKVLTNFTESYFEISAGGRKLSEATTATEAQKVADGAKKLFGSSSVSGPNQRFTPNSITKGLENALGYGAPNTPAAGTTKPPEPVKPADPVAVVKTKSGKDWVAKFPTSTSVDDLEKDFAASFKDFQKALADAKATTSISATLRPKERAYMMHWAWKIVNEGTDASKIPELAGVNIDWWHGNQADSKKAAQEMVDGFGIGALKVAPSLTSRHIEGKAVDMSVSWNGTLTIKNKDGTEVKITSDPKDHTNADLIKVAATYGVIHFTVVADDKVHWSTDGK